MRFLTSMLLLFVALSIHGHAQTSDRADALRSAATLYAPEHGVVVLIDIVDRSYREQLHATDFLAVLQYRRNNNYECYVAQENIEQLLALPEEWNIRFLRAEEKLSPFVLENRMGEHAERGDSLYAFSAFYYKYFPVDVVQRRCEELTEYVEYVGPHARLIRFVGTVAQAREFANEVFVKSVDQVSPPDETDNRPGRVMAGARRIKEDYGFDGNGIKVGIWDADGADPHYDFRDRFQINDNPGTVHYHHTHVVGTVGGAGTLEERGTGVAPQVAMFGHSWTDDIDERVATVDSNHITISSQSYARRYCAMPN